LGPKTNRGKPDEIQRSSVEKSITSPPESKSKMPSLPNANSQADMIPER